MAALLLAVDVGNTNTVIGALDAAGAVVHRWRVSTRERTTDEVALLIESLLTRSGLGPDDLSGAIVSCVVPEVLFSVQKALGAYLGLEALVVGRGLKTGLPLRVDNPREVGADRIVNAAAAVERFGAPVIVVDFGTATTVDVVDARGAYIGGAIAPGFRISAEALVERTSKLPRVEIQKPERAIGANTVAAMQSGLFNGYVGLVEHLVAQVRSELSGPATCVATGGFSRLIGQACSQVDHIDEHLALSGLALLHRRNRR